MIQGLRVAAAEIRGVRASVARQMVAGVVLAAVAAAAGAGRQHGASPRRACGAPDVLKRFNVTCTRSGVTFESGDTSDRDLVFQRIRVAVPIATGTERMTDGLYDVRLDAGSAVRLRAGATARTPFTLDDKRAEICARAGACGLVFDLTLASTERGPLPLQARGECTPGWGDASDAVPGRLELLGLDRPASRGRRASRRTRGARSARRSACARRSSAPGSPAARAGARRVGPRSSLAMRGCTPGHHRQHDGGDERAVDKPEQQPEPPGERCAA